MNNLIGIAMIVCGVLLGVYVGLWLCFIGGIVDIIQQFKSEIISEMVIAIGICKILFAGFIGSTCASILIFPGLRIIK